MGLEKIAPTAKTDRTLRTIIAGDVVSYSRHMQVAEEETLSSLNRHRAVIDYIIESRAGRIFTTAGDSVLAEFESPVEAVRCALDIQQAVNELHNSQVDVRPLVFRFGVHTGDVIRNGDNVLGDAVNIAARLESISKPGSVLVSQVVRDFVESRLHVQFVFRGRKKVKNIAKPLATYEVVTKEIPRWFLIAERLIPSKRLSVSALAIGLVIYLAAAYDILGILKSGTGVRLLPENTVLLSEPPAGAITPGERMYVDDGRCPTGKIKEIIGGNMTLNIARSKRCVDRESVKISN